MTDQKFNRQTMTEYLLGAVSEAEAERFDELSFTDSEFADSLASAEKDLVDAYVRGELTGLTLEKFESHYLASPLRREKTEFAETLRTYAEKNFSQAGKTFAGEKSKPVETFWASLNIFKNRNFIIQWGVVAAVLLLMILTGFWIFKNRSDRQDEAAKQNIPAGGKPETTGQVEKSRAENSNATPDTTVSSENKLPAIEPVKEQPEKTAFARPKQIPEQEKTVVSPKISIASFILAPPLRGGNEIKSLSISPKTTDINLHLELEPDDFVFYRVALKNESSSRSLWRSGTLKAIGKEDSKRLHIQFPAKLLKSKIYSVEISAVDSTGNAEIIGNYPFRVMLK